MAQFENSVPSGQGTTLSESQERISTVGSQNAKNDSSFFRAKTEPVKETPVSPSEERKPASPTLHIPEYTEKPPSIKEEPFLIEMLEIGEAKDHFEMPALINQINSFVLEEIIRQKLNDDTNSYKEIVQAYINRLKLPEGIDIYTKIEEIAELMRIDKKLLDTAREKEDLLKKSITELSSKQLRERIEGELNANPSPNN